MKRGVVMVVCALLSCVPFRSLDCETDRDCFGDESCNLATMKCELKGDAGALFDAGVRVDGGATLDAGMAVDSGTSSDAGTPDAGSPYSTWDVSLWGEKIWAE